MKTDIINRTDVIKLVDSFYGKVQKDELLGPVFNQAIGSHWGEHLEKMYCFWETVLLDEHTYFGSPFPPHARLPIEKNHFDKWLEIFENTLNDHFKGDKAAEALHRASNMAKMFQYKIEYLQNQKPQSIM